MRKPDSGKLRLEDVLRLSPKKRSQSTVRRRYDQLRCDTGHPERCDNPSCHFHSNPLIWNGKKFKPILDHIDGNRFDNRPKNLRYLCPNCDSQLPTRGGGNRDRVEKIDENGDGCILRNRDGSKIASAIGRASGQSAVSGISVS